MSYDTTAARGGSVLPGSPAERYIPKVTNVDPDFSLQPDRHERPRAERGPAAGRGSWAARVPVINWFVPR